MKHLCFVGASAAVLLLCSLAAAEELKSGPQPGTSLAPFHPLNVYNAQVESLSGKKNCLV